MDIIRLSDTINVSIRAELANIYRNTIVSPTSGLDYLRRVNCWCCLDSKFSHKDNWEAAMVAPAMVSSGVYLDTGIPIDSGRTITLYNFRNLWVLIYEIVSEIYRNYSLS